MDYANCSSNITGPPRHREYNGSTTPPTKERSRANNKHQRVQIDGIFSILSISSYSIFGGLLCKSFLLGRE